MPTEGPAAGDTCKSCGGSVKKGALLCPHCGEQQKSAWSLRRTVAVAGIIVTWLSLVFAIEKLVGTYRAWTESRIQAQKSLAAVGPLVVVGDYAAAWRAIEQAQGADPTSARLRAVQIQVATAWVVDGQPVPTGWYPSKSAGATEPVISPGRAAEQVSRALALAAAYAGDSADADLLALTVWGQYLRSRELLTRRRNFGSELLQIAQSHPTSHLANLFAGYWLAVMEDNPQSSWPYWGKAMTSPKEAARTRLFQIVALGQGLRSEPTDQRELARSMLVTVLNDMRRGNEAFPAALRIDWLVSIWLDRRNTFDMPDRWPSAPPPAQQLDTLDWFEKRYEFLESSGQSTRLLYIRGRLLEEAGRRQEALTVYQKADLSRTDHRLASFFDEAIERLGGAPPADALVRDEWRRYTYQVTTLPPDSQEFRTALEAIKEEAGQVIHYGDPTLSGRFPPALDAAIASLSKWTEQSDGRSSDTNDLERQLKELLVARGRLRNRLSDYENALRDLEPISSAPQTPKDLRASALAYIAEVYADRSRQWAHSPEGDLLSEADIREGFDRMQAAVAAGFDDWDWIESRLSELRQHPEYVKFSIEHGRLPPQDEKDN